LPPQRQWSRQWIEVVKAVAADVSEHELAVLGRFGARLFQTLTLRPCLRIFTSQARKVLVFRREEEGVETRLEGSQVIPEGQSGLLGARLSPPAAVAAGSAALEDLARAVDRDLATPDLAPSTERAYAHDWADFSAFCARHGLEALPAVPQTLALYLKSLEARRSQSLARRAAVLGGNAPLGLALPTLRRRLAAIAGRHASAGLETPTDHPLVRKMLRRYARSRGTAVQKKDPLLIERLPTLMLAMPDDVAALRDRALLLLGYAGAFRRSELVALDVEDLKFLEAGAYVWIAAAKNDTRKKGRELYVPRLPTTELCAVAAVEAWLDIAGATGPIFRTFDLRGRLTSTRLDPGDVARILRRRCAAAGVEGDFAGHSLRRGFITNAAKKKIPIENIKRVTGQRSTGILLDYVAAATLDEEPPLLEIIRS
jgi:integrase